MKSHRSSVTDVAQLVSTIDLIAAAEANLQADVKTRRFHGVTGLAKALIHADNLSFAKHGKLNGPPFGMRQQAFPTIEYLM